ncbi:Oidioi.mRNA.OKI2018_I69.PAR.g10073.t1.cds [Oikopleura dioica]|uniref:Oidioi.mRNA.OKI2018_I69.PAR.g10073.t1.cds n=1 Tax=Oikopleura dioica TaxID=34765 RepID=A0ABN7RWI9_OIKDI|nr:Oidioi.mRNA.OKI2018_I69.PAR.g10073.t1.cds [Oikopleura dioica]
MENLGDTTATSILDSSVAPAEPSDRWYSGGTLYETAEDMSADATAISEVAAPDNSHMSVDKQNSTVVEGSATENSKKRTRPKSSPDRQYSAGADPNATLTEVGAAHLPKHTKRAHRETRPVEPLNIGTNSGQSYD